MKSASIGIGCLLSLLVSGCLGTSESVRAGDSIARIREQMVLSSREVEAGSGEEVMLDGVTATAVVRRFRRTAEDAQAGALPAVGLIDLMRGGSGD